MREYTTRNKIEELQELIPSVDVSLKKRCRFCDTTFRVYEAKIYITKQNEKVITCPNAPLCNGTIENWSKIIFV